VLNLNQLRQISCIYTIKKFKINETTPKHLLGQSKRPFTSILCSLGEMRQHWQYLSMPSHISTVLQITFNAGQPKFIPVRDKVTFHFSLSCPMLSPAKPTQVLLGQPNSWRLEATNFTYANHFISLNSPCTAFCRTQNMKYSHSGLHENLPAGR